MVWWGLVDEFWKEVVPDGHVVVRRKGGGGILQVGMEGMGLGGWSPVFQRKI